MDNSPSTRPVLLPDSTQASRPRLPSANIKPLNISSKLPPKSRLPTLRNNSLVDTSNIPTPRTYGAYGFQLSNTEASVSEVFTSDNNALDNENVTPAVRSGATNSVKTKGKATNNFTKRKSGPDSHEAGPSTKRSKPDNPRVNQIKDNKRARARRSVSNALKISRNKVKAQVPPPIKKSVVAPAKRAPVRAAPVKPQRPAVAHTSTWGSHSVKPKPPAKKTTPEIKKAPGSANSSRNSGGSTASGEKKSKRKPWDLRGQVDDLKDELARSKEKESTIENILNRLNALEKENHTMNIEKTELSTNVNEQQQHVYQLEMEVREKDKRLRDQEVAYREQERKRDLEKEDLLNQLRKLQRSRDDLDLENRQLRRDNIEYSDKNADLTKRNESQADEIARMQADIKEKFETIRQLENEMREAEADRKTLLNVVQELKGNIRVFCRVRPMLKKEVAEFGAMDHIEFTGKGGKSMTVTNDTNKPTTYSFDRVFNAETSQETVFSDVAQLVQSALDGYNVCIFAYGQTGAGKTYTMEGPDKSSPDQDGIIPRSMKLIFQKCEEQKKFGWRYTLAVQHVEIYRETLQDLLQTNNDPNVKLEIKTITKGGKQQRVWVKNLSQHPVLNFNQVRSLLNQSKTKRATAATNANERSSRSHSVFILNIEAKNDLTGEDIESSLNLIDLAGSERLAETGSSGTRLKEAQKINGSLSELSNVISSLANKDSHVPFRNSKLTFLLMNSLGGNSKTLMLVNVNPTKRATGETINTLRFATTVNKCHIGTAQKVIKFN